MLSLNRRAPNLLRRALVARTGPGVRAFSVTPCAVTGHGGDVPNFINGKFEKSRADHFIDNLNPATQELISRVPESTEDEMRAAVEGAVAAQKEWKQVPPQVRARVMFKMKDLIEENKERLAKCITTEHGKTLPDAHLAVEEPVA